MTKKEIVNGYHQMRQDINEQKDEYLAKIYTVIKKYFNEVPEEKWSFENFLTITGIDNIVFESLEETFIITSKAVEKLYDIKANSSEKIGVEDLMYSADNKTLYDRLKEHFNNAIKRDEPTQYMFNRCVLILDTETSCVSNGVIHGRMNRHAKYVEILEGADCVGESESPCEYWIVKKKMPIEELEELPPYHPDCDCEVIYYTE